MRNSFVYYYKTVVKIENTFTEKCIITKNNHTSVHSIKYCTWSVLMYMVISVKRERAQTILELLLFTLTHRFVTGPLASLETIFLVVEHKRSYVYNKKWEETKF